MASGAITTYLLDNNGLIESTLHSEGYTTTLVYSTRGYIAKEIQPYGTVLSATYDDFGRLVKDCGDCVSLPATVALWRRRVSRNHSRNAKAPSSPELRLRARSIDGEGPGPRQLGPAQRFDSKNLGANRGEVLYDETHGATAVEARTGGPSQCNDGGKGDGVARETSRWIILQLHEVLHCCGYDHPPKTPHVETCNSVVACCIARVGATPPLKDYRKCGPWLNR